MVDVVFVDVKIVGMLSGGIFDVFGELLNKLMVKVNI